MTHLYEEVLESIKAIDICVLDAEIDVTKSLIEEYTRHLSILNSVEAEGIILEGEWFTKQREEGENIFKTIFLFIPRLIVNLIDKIKLLWQKHKDKKEGKDINNIEVSQEMVNAERQKMIAERTGDPRVVVIGNSYGVLTKLNCGAEYFENAAKLYLLFDLRFREYAELLDTSNIGKAMEDAIMNRITMEDQQIFVNEPSFPLTPTKYLEYKNELIKTIGQVTFEVEAIMKRSIREYEERLKSLDTFSVKEKSIAEEFVKMMTKTYNDFQTFDLEVRTELDQVRRSFERISAEIHKDEVNTEAKGEEE